MAYDRVVAATFLDQFFPVSDSNAAGKLKPSPVEPPEQLVQVEANSTPNGSEKADPPSQKVEFVNLIAKPDEADDFSVSPLENRFDSLSQDANIIDLTAEHEPMPSTSRSNAQRSCVIKTPIQQLTQANSCQNVAPNSLNMNSMRMLRIEDEFASIHPSRDGKFHCKHCEYASIDRSKLRRHGRVHTRDRPFIRTICKKTFAERGGLNRHERHHKTELKFLCTNCGRRFKFRNDMKSHENRCNGSQYECHLCRYLANCKADLITHFRIHVGERPLECSQSSKRFHRKSALTKHIKRCHM